VKVQFFLVNDSSENLFVLNWFTPLEGLGGDIFQVRRDGQTVRYQGPLAERAEPSPEAYTLIAAGEAVWAEVDLTRARAYDFSVPGNYTIRFNSPRLSHIARSEAEMTSTYGELGPIQIASNEVTVTIEDGDR
jgi:peptidyl-Lys metalloendopeptidase